MKIMGLNTEAFEHDMVIMARRYDPKLHEGAINIRPSRSEKYIAMTITFNASSQKQINAMYAEAHKHPDFRMAL